LTETALVKICDADAKFCVKTNFKDFVKDLYTQNVKCQGPELRPRLCVKNEDKPTRTRTSL